ncbi:hypothetical protein SAMN05216344_103106 [Polaromonas sp. OV174]|nr:hypothetical protein SAMN05216344_103106 [Polaromonas sp. OV174]
MHNLCTILYCFTVDNLWVSCGSSLHSPNQTQIVTFKHLHMPKNHKDPMNYNQIHY